MPAALPAHALGVRHADPRHRGWPKSRSRHRMRSKAQHRYFWHRAQRDPKWRRWAEQRSVRGRYRQLPERVSAPTARTLR